ncbi:MAG: sialidase family protein [Myxococcota bacterium]
MPRAEPNGSYDPDLVRDPDTGRLWMVYSGVDGAAGAGLISTHLASSDDDGRTWCHAGRVNAAAPVPRSAQPAALAQDAAHWSHEVATLAFVPDAPAETRWWLAWNRYLHVVDADPRTEDRRFEHGWVAVRRAASPEALLGAEERKLFSARGYHADPAVEAWNEAAPGGPPEQRWDRDEAFGDCLVLIEGSLLAVDGRLLWAGTCVRRGRLDVVLASFDVATRRWSAEGTLLTPEDAEALEPRLTAFNAPDLYGVGDEVRLLVSPVAGAYRGCLEFALDVDRRRVGAPLTAIAPKSGAEFLQSGPCTFAEGTALGIVSGDTRRSGIQFVMEATGIPAAGP